MATETKAKTDSSLCTVYYYFIFLQCYDTVGWATTKAFSPEKKHVQFIVKGSLPEDAEKENKENWLTKFRLENGIGTGISPY